MENAVGFYWTLPVTWAQFVELPRDVEAAASASKTIRYQMELIRRYAKEHGFNLIHEEVFLEIQPDRGSIHIQSALDSIERICRTGDATILVVDFSVVQNWRRHGYMDEWFENTHMPIVRIPPDPLRTTEWSFDPGQHFGDWRQRHSYWMSSKHEREVFALRRSLELQKTGLSVNAIAEQLNMEKTPSPTGKPWRESNLRTFLKRQE
ncbi:recombinase family protein [Ruegeria lacuscaerulensis]|uniref:recombinase family protein n=1 Tax=Ruegeria lacuscaerulensis TaxID=55218 RepID=UPI00147F31A6|nr:recombinase family protein [Ruegeria lacuscaerulensis]